MAPRKGKESLLDLCGKATTLGNSISVRMLEYLSTVKEAPHGFRELATNFLDICRVLCSIEAGLSEASRTHSQFPNDMQQELDKKFRQTNDDFIVLNQMLIKFLEYEKKGSLGKLKKGWHMMFADTDIHKMKDSLARSRDALGMSAMVFRWYLGDAKADASVGIGYTGLAAVLERMNPSIKQTAPTVAKPPLLPPVSEGADLLPPLPAIPLTERTSESNFMSHFGEDPDTLTAIPQRQSFSRPAPSTRSSKLTVNSATRDLQMMSSESSRTEVAVEDHVSVKTAESFGQIEDMIHEIGLDKNSPIARVKADPATVPRWTPKQTSGATSAALKSTLLNAVQQKKHKMIEQLLDCGVPPDGENGVNLLREAVLHQDVETVRLLLLFGADPNGLDKIKFSPLLSATELSFLDAAKLLLKYGADPNLPAGPDGECPLAMAVIENKLEFLQLYLTYGGDANLNTADGNTLLIKAITKTNPKKLAELLVDYGSDVNGKNSEGETPLFTAIQAKRVDIMIFLLDHGADPNLPGPKHLLWPSTYQPKALQLLLSRGADFKKCPGILELATSINHLESVTILLRAGVDPNAKKDGVYTPLCTAIRDNRGELVSLLLANGADANVMASEYPAFKCVTHDRTHLLPQLVAAGANLHKPKGIIEKAVAHNNKDALMYLLDQHVSPNDRGAEGYTPLTTAIRDDRVEFVDILLAHGADPGIRGQDWPICMAVKRPEMLRKLLPSLSNPRAVKGVLEMAVVANQLESIKLLLKAGVSVEDKNGGVFSPLTTAIREDRKEIVRFLLEEAGADVNAPGEHLPIIKAIRRCRSGDTDIIEMLLARGADINLMYRGWNAVLQAVENGDAKVLKLLVERGGGVDLEAKDESGRTVMDIVNGRGWDEAVNILLGRRGGSPSSV
ncbi:uncharacterized protein Z519_04277 [Cladophialophora bantiana CBS 173.52]|uniref:NACHT-NTPase and P-loop NTPases N-terminal domain-containing protein n=1 Tax=Cladophialophora bantiana (strain ATCC 10958 / CBS 173.52 / CDC B-1940 / NIH 8579) TaxID=1442370 RepID=A0A0D2GAT3_CLAB1|nr:uncharacterized protein Z519_04277 [Cladophialophora bantiana CBS 173.52]KIW95692.1 hypothetical protein Z519_04277 [Cladophialophora bantiana CBS 173.52]